MKASDLKEEDLFNEWRLIYSSIHIPLVDSSFSSLPFKSCDNCDNYVLIVRFYRFFSFFSSFQDSLHPTIETPAFLLCYFYFISNWWNSRGETTTPPSILSITSSVTHSNISNTITSHWFLRFLPIWVWKGETGEEWDKIYETTTIIYFWIYEGNKSVAGSTFSFPFLFLILIVLGEDASKLSSEVAVQIMKIVGTHEGESRFPNSAYMKSITYGKPTFTLLERLDKFALRQETNKSLSDLTSSIDKALDSTPAVLDENYDDI